MRRYLAALLLIPLLDAAVMVGLVAVVGAELVVLAVVLTALVGMLLVRAEGRHTLRQLQVKLGEGTLPTDELTDGGLLLIAGAFLLTPGLVTDTVGLLLVLPPTRYPIRTALLRWVIRPYLERRTKGFASGNVYIGGFPGSDGDASGAGGFVGGPGGRGGPGGPGGSGGPGASGGGADGSRSGSDGGRGDDVTIDLGEDDYTVESGTSVDIDEE
jgi:UPF0716 protein FxsA